MLMSHQRACFNSILKPLRKIRVHRRSDDLQKKAEKPNLDL